MQENQPITISHLKMDALSFINSVVSAIPQHFEGNNVALRNLTEAVNRLNEHHQLVVKNLVLLMLAVNDLKPKPKRVKKSLKKKTIKQRKKK